VTKPALDSDYMKAINIEWDLSDDDYEGDIDDIDLPTEIEIPDGMTDEDEISDFLSDETGFCHCGFDLED
jgi:hypothetical protein